MSLPDAYWERTAEFLRRRLRPGELVCAPNDFLGPIRATCHYSVTGHLPPETFRLVALHKGMLDWLDREFLRTVVENWHPVFANEVFVVYDRQRRGKCPAEHVHPVRDFVHSLPPPPPEVGNDAVVVTTYERFWAFSRVLPQLAATGVPILVVDDGSEAATAEAKERLCMEHGVEFLHLPSNRGVSAALNVGVAYWLADRTVEWIMEIQDDVVLRSDSFEVMRRVRDRCSRPVVVPYLAPQHPIYATDTIRGVDVSYQYSASGQAIQAHRDYWAAVLPIPTLYLGAPKKGRGRPGQASDEDWWVTAWAPRSATKSGLPVTCIPGLAEHLATADATSTWRGTGAAPD